MKKKGVIHEGKRGLIERNIWQEMKGLNEWNLKWNLIKEGCNKWMKE